MRADIDETSTMRGTIILSHGFESGPDATKTSAMAAVAGELGWRTQRPDFRDLDTHGLEAAVAPRCERLRELARAAEGPLVLAGSSMGAYVSVRVAHEVPCVGLFLLATPVAMAEAVEPLELPAGIPVTMVHGFADELCPADDALAFAQRQHAHVLMVADGHRLSLYVDWIAQQFGLFLRHLGQAPARPPA
ncbi:MAG TPA: alpha/beta hydrolase [Rhodanobacteraceae bacterium]|nr:alpha/beta hydrolase [Rhodanobacteraceae bacterium]